MHNLVEKGAMKAMAMSLTARECSENMCIYTVNCFGLKLLGT